MSTPPKLIIKTGGTYERDTAAAWDPDYRPPVRLPPPAAVQPTVQAPRQAQTHSSYAAAINHQAQPSIRPAHALFSSQSRAGLPVIPAQRPFRQQPDMQRHRSPNHQRGNFFMGEPTPTAPPDLNKVLLLKEYQDEPEDGSNFVRGFLPWSAAESPLASGGHSRELDELRLSFKCHIVYNKELEAFKIFSKNEHIVESALIEIRKKLQINEHVAAGAFKIFLARLPKDHTLRLVRKSPATNDLINQVKYDEKDAIMKMEKVPGAPIPTDWQIWSNQLNFIQTNVFNNTVSARVQALKAIDSGLLVRVTFGIPIFHQYIWESKNLHDLPLQAFVQNLREIKTNISLSKLHHSPRLLDLALQHVNFLKSPDPDALADIKPCFEILFKFPKTANGKDGKQLHVTGRYEYDDTTAVSRNWREHADRARVGQVLEVFSIKFDNGFSWKLSVDAAHNPSKSTEEDREFAASVRLEERDPTFSPMAQPRLRFKFRANDKIFEIKQKTIWRMSLTDDSRWTVEVTRYDSFTRRSSGYIWSPDMPQWDLTVHHPYWNVLVSGTATQKLIDNVSSLLLPDEGDEMTAPAAIRKFSMMMNKISDNLSLSMNS